MKQACHQHVLIAPLFLDLVIQASKDYLLSFNVSLEIARFIHSSVLANKGDPLDFDQFMFYNLDRIRLEEHLRHFLLIRILDAD
jgi:hypothetical protein